MTYLRSVIAVMSLGGLVVSMGCEDRGTQSAQSSGSDSAPPSAVSANAPGADAYRTLIGLVHSRRGPLCLAIPALLNVGDELTIVTVPITGNDFTDPAVIQSAQVTAQPAGQCKTDSTGVGSREAGDSVYILSVASDTIARGTAHFAVLAPLARFSSGDSTPFIQLAQGSDKVTFRICTSGEGLHYTAWLGAPLTGRRIWHRYYYFGYDTTPSCKPDDYVGT